MKKKILKYIFLTFGAAGLLHSCTADEPDTPLLPSGEALFEATISGLGETPGQETRALIATGADKWSYLRFNSPTDTIGFFSAKGNLSDDGGNGPFINEPMVWARSVSGSTDSRWRGVFSGVNMNYNAGLIQTENNKTFVYFPYAIGVEDPGLRLRRKGPDGKDRCVDALYILNIDNNSDAVMSGSFIHGFSELMITRGYGFDSPPPGCEKITVVLNNGYSHVKVMDYPDTNHDYWKVLMPVYDPKYSMSEDECRRWEAWEGEPYKPTEFSEAKPAYYCIVPTSLSNYRSVVDYIEICDNLGQWHKITSFYLFQENDKRVQPNQRYDLDVVMEGLVPTIYPYTIHPWDDMENITDERSSGINNPSDFVDFVTIYNSYITSEGNRNPQFEEQLKRFGDKYTTDGQIGWHFYINNSFDVNDILDNNYNYRINNLCDTIDGMRNTLKGLRINNSSGFIGELRDKGCVMNLDVAGLNVTNSYGEDMVTGGLVDYMSGGLITGCSVDGFVNTPGYVGMAAGQMSGGKITGCTFTGLLVGRDTYQNLFGKTPTGNSEWTGNNSSGLIFTQ